MHEHNALKTLGFFVVAVVAALGAWASKPQPPKTNMGGLIGEKMFPKATPADVARMEIRQYDEANHKVVSFEVGRVDGVWCIPSHSNYPADENNHLAEAATALMGVKVLDVAFGAGDELAQMDAAGIRARHNEYGVLDPDPEKIKSSDKGVGMLVTLKNKDNQSLASCIIGKPVPDQPEQHYIRFADKDQVYTVALDTSKLSTHFDDWIERNLLKLNSIDLKQVQIKDYSIDIVGNRAAPHQNGVMTLDYTSSGDSSWKLSEDMEYNSKKRALVPRVMAADEELDTTKLNELKSALDDLKIVDVEKKPAAVPPDLRFKDDQVSEVVLRSLQDKGFYAAEDPEKGAGFAMLFASKGDIRLQLNDGACYVLRFGEATGETSSKTKDAGKDKAASAKDEKKDEATPGMNRYLFVMAEFNPNALTKPKMEPLPEEPKAGDKKSPEKKDDKKPDDKKTGDAKDVAKTEPAKSAEKEPPKVDIKAERERITKDNKRKQEDYDALVSAGKKHVADLNARFAPWYYVISDDVFRKIHLSREQIIKKKAKDTKDKDGHEHEHDHADLPPIEQPKPGPLDELHKATDGVPSK